MKVETDKLVGAQLDWAVAKAEGHSPYIQPATGLNTIKRGCVVDYYNPSSNWSWAGPIIENELHSIQHAEHSKWGGVIWQAESGDNLAYGPTFLIAAMRCYVKTKLGHTVEVPNDYS